MAAGAERRIPLRCWSSRPAARPRGGRRARRAPSGARCRSAAADAAILAVSSSAEGAGRRAPPVTTRPRPPARPARRPRPALRALARTGARDGGRRAARPLHATSGSPSPHPPSPAAAAAAVVGPARDNRPPALRWRGGAWLGLERPARGHGFAFWRRGLPGPGPSQPSSVTPTSGRRAERGPPVSGPEVSGGGRALRRLAAPAPPPTPTGGRGRGLGGGARLGHTLAPPPPAPAAQLRARAPSSPPPPGSASAAPVSAGPGRAGGLRGWAPGACPGSGQR